MLQTIRVSVPAILALLTGCPLPDDDDGTKSGDSGRGEDTDTGPSDTAPGAIEDLHAYIPQDGSRRATWEGEDGSLLVGEKVGVEIVDAVERVRWRYRRDGNVVAEVVWASDDAGVRIYEWTSRSGRVEAFDTPVRLTPESDAMRLGDAVVTVTDGHTFTSTLVGVEDISVEWGLDWEGALHFVVEGDEDAWFVGEYWLVERYGPGWMRVDGFFWNLADYDWAED